jgi:hypothetical protein
MTATLFEQSVGHLHKPRTQLRNPREAAKAFAQVPRQRNVFLVRFQQNGAVGNNTKLFDSLSFAVKSVDRPRINPKTEELHQYNKKRQVYTGFRIEPVRFQFYDNAAGAAQKLWRDYARFYFGDFNHTANYNYDAVGTTFYGDFADYGYTTNRIANGEQQFYFDHIDILQIHKGNQYDQYRLIHPRITQWEPDDLDYSNNDVALISMQVMYENLQYTFGQSTTGLADFTKGATFDGDVWQVSGTTDPYPIGSVPSDATSSAAPVSSFLSPIPPGPLGEVADYRYEDDLTGGPLESFGNFSYGSVGSLVGLARRSVPLAVALDLGLQINPFVINKYSLRSAAMALLLRGLDGAVYDVAAAQAAAVTSGYGTIDGQLTAGIIAADDISGDAANMTPDGIVLAPPAYGAMNARQTGTAQYGYNTEAAWGTAVNPQY